MFVQEQYQLPQLLANTGPVHCFYPQPQHHLQHHHHSSRQGHLNSQSDHSSSNQSSSTTPNTTTTSSGLHGISSPPRSRATTQAATSQAATSQAATNHKTIKTKSELSSPSSYKQKEDVPECHICLEEINPNDKIKTLPCKHSFHNECTTQWLRVKKTCPLCRIRVELTTSEYTNQDGEVVIVIDDDEDDDDDDDDDDIDDNDDDDDDVDDDDDGDGDDDDDNDDDDNDNEADDDEDDPEDV